MATLNGVQLTQAIAACYGQTVTDDQAQHIVWNYTGYPGFWKTDRPIEEMRHQIAAYLRGERSCDRCGTRLRRVEITRRWPSLCRSCKREV